MMRTLLGTAAVAASAILVLFALGMSIEYLAYWVGEVFGVA